MKNSTYISVDFTTFEIFVLIFWYSFLLFQYIIYSFELLLLFIIYNKLLYLLDLYFFCMIYLLCTCSARSAFVPLDLHDLQYLNCFYLSYPEDKSHKHGRKKNLLTSARTIGVRYADT